MAALDSKNNKEIILIDGNAIIFRSFYATQAQAMLKTSKGFYTNALVPFIRMIKRIIKTKHTHFLVLFDTGKPTFRKEIAKDYKANRSEAPKELVEQFKYCRDFLTAAGIKYEERAGYEADDLIGSYAKKYQKLGYKVNIFSGDKDLLQLVDTNINVSIFISGAKFIDTYKLDNMVEKTSLNSEQYKEMMALAGDPSDNIKGLPGIGEKTSINLLTEFGSIANVYKNIEQVKKPKVKETLINYKEQLFTELELVTILTDLELSYKPQDLVFDEIQYSSELEEFYIKFELLNELKEIARNDLFAASIEMGTASESDFELLMKEEALAISYKLNNDNYHFANLEYLIISNGEINYQVENLEQNRELLNRLFNSNIKLLVYDLKQLIVVLNKYNFTINNQVFDIMVANYLINPDYGNDDISELCIKHNLKTYLTKSSDQKEFTIHKVMEIYALAPFLYQELKAQNLEAIYANLEYPLIFILAKMELEGIRVDSKLLAEEIKAYSQKTEQLTSKIYKLAGTNFNLNSPKQLADILFNRLGLPNLRKDSTSIEVLDKLTNYPIVNNILNYRLVNKVLTTYLLPYQELLINNYLHTIYTQTIARTGRLSSISPNLQNIPNYGDGKNIRKIFNLEDGYLYLSLDYSQIELRVLAYLAGDKELLRAFEHNVDIHANTAKKLFNHEEISDDERRIAKAVNFGIIYGQTAFGLANELNIAFYQANNLLINHKKTFPLLHNYLELLVKKTKAEGYSKTIQGRIRKIDFSQKGADRLALNSPIQGSAADIIKLAMIKVNKYLEDNNLKTKLVMQIHDELIFKMPLNELDHAQNIANLMCQNEYGIPLNINIKKGKDLLFNA